MHLFFIHNQRKREYMAKKNTTFKVVACYDGQRDAKEVFAELISDKVRKSNKLTMEKMKERRYNRVMSCDDLPGLAG
jgi:hypothetical protein